MTNTITNSAAQLALSERSESKRPALSERRESKGPALSERRESKGLALSERRESKGQIAWRMRHTITLLLIIWAADVHAQDDPFARHAWHLQVASHTAIETWNYNISHEALWSIVPGFAYGIRDGLALAATWPMYYVDQRGSDVWLIGATIGLRGRFYRRTRVSLFWEFDVGVSKAETYTPPRGTRFNYLALGGAGATVRVRPGTHLLAGLRWIHVSNNGLAGRHRNPDIEAVGPQVGILISF